MKRRIVISITAAIIALIVILVRVIAFKDNDVSRLTTWSVVYFVYIGIYFFGGLPKFVIYFIYGLLTGIGMYFLSDYQLAFVVAGSLLFILSPLAAFERHLEKKLSDEDSLPIRMSLRGSYWPNYAYRRAMKEYYHLPQTRKLYTKKWYLRLRQACMLLIFFVATFLFINEVGRTVAVDFNAFNWISFFNVYIVIVLYILAFVLHKKGFTSMFRSLIVSMFPILIFLVTQAPFSETTRIVMSVLSLVVAIVIAIYELYIYYQRVAYQSYEYRDPDKNWEVYANATFEPLVYNETFTKVVKFSFDCERSLFEKNFHDILVYANFRRFIITAYAFSPKGVVFYADFHHKAGKRIMKFKNYLDKKLKRSVDIQIIDDVNKKVYETNFFHKTEYIVARATHLAELLKELEIKSEVIISTIFYFESLADLKSFQDKYFTVRLEHLEDENIYTVRADILSQNVDYIIEQKVREILMDAMIYRGNYVRISVFY